MKLKLDKEPAAESDPLTFDFEVEGASPRGFAGFAASIGARNLMIIIVTMPIVFLVVVLAIVGIFGDPKKDTSRMAGPAAPTISVAEETAPAPSNEGRRAVLPVPAAAAATAGIRLPEGADIAAMALDGDRLALRVNGPEGAEILIYDLAEDQVVKIVPLEIAGVE